MVPLANSTDVATASVFLFIATQMPEVRVTPEGSSCVKSSPIVNRSVGDFV